MIRGWVLLLTASHCTGVQSLLPLSSTGWASVEVVYVEDHRWDRPTLYGLHHVPKPSGGARK
eukprot:2761728-Amphidinium_carterae.1